MSRSSPARSPYTDSERGAIVVSQPSGKRTEILCRPLPTQSRRPTPDGQCRQPHAKPSEELLKRRHDSVFTSETLITGDLETTVRFDWLHHYSPPFGLMSLGYTCTGTSACSVVLSSTNSPRGLPTPDRHPSQQLRPDGSIVEALTVFESDFEQRHTTEKS
jgi:hypothetical protein